MRSVRNRQVPIASKPVGWCQIQKLQQTKTKGENEKQVSYERGKHLSARHQGLKGLKDCAVRRKSVDARAGGCKCGGLLETVAVAG